MVESQPSADQASRSSGFVGRQRELDELKVALADAQSGRGRLVMLVGEPGIGKTRTAQELTNHAQELGMQVWWGRCYEEQGTPPYWPWVQLLQSLVQEKSPQQLSTEMGPGAADIAEAVPELRQKLPDLEPPPILEPEQARFRFFNSVTSSLKNAAASRPLVLILDDLHWADNSSLLLLQFLARRLTDSHIVVVGTYRDVEVSRQHPLAGTLAQLSREPVFRRLELQGLSREDTGYFIETKAGISPSRRVTDAIYSHTEGNPFFTTEVLRLLREQGGLFTEELPHIQLPAGVREVIGQRLNRLSEHCHQTLTSASIIGREFELRLLGRLSGETSEEQLLAIMDEALEVHLIEELPGRADCYQFSHSLVQQTLADELSTSRKVRLHARIAETLEELYGAKTEVHAPELAYHFVQAEPVLGAEKLLKYCLLAGEQALARCAYDEALAHFQRGLEARKQEPMDSNYAELLYGLARSQVGTNERLQQARAQGTLIQAFDIFVAVGDTQRAIEVAAYPLRSTSANSQELLERALELVPSDSHAAGKLLSQYGWVLGSTQVQGYERACDAFNRALIIARNHQDKPLEMKTLVAAGHVDAFCFRHDDCLEKDLRAIELASQVSEPLEESHAHYELAQVLYCMGDLARATKHAEAMLAPAERSGHRYRLANSHTIRGTVYALKGDWERARPCFEHTLQISPRDCLTLEELAILEFQQGNVNQGEGYVGQLLEAFRQAEGSQQRQYRTSIAMTFSISSKITGDDTRLDEAEELATNALSNSSGNLLGHTGARVALGLAAVQKGIVKLAQEQYFALAHLAGSTHRYGQGVVFDHLLGLLANTMGDFDQAQTHFENALAFCRKGYRPELAWTCHDYAEALVQRDHHYDQARAISLLDEGLNISRELGMRPLMERVIALQEQLHAQPEPAPAYPDGLSEREVEVLKLVAAGKSNPEIAQELFISANTVAHHVTNILNKINAANRTEAASYATRHGLIQQRGNSQ